MTRVLITGVRGKTGAPLAELLVAQGVEVRGGTSVPRASVPDGVEPVAFAWDRPDDWPSATAGVDALYLVRPDLEEAPALAARLLAVTPQDARVTLLSEQGADTFGPDAWARRVEDVVTSSGRDWTLLRPSWFMQVFTDERFYRDVLFDRAVLDFPAGDGTLAWIDARDISAVAARTLIEDGHSGAAYELTGPQALTLGQTTARIAEAVGRRVVHEDLPISEAVTGLAGFDRYLFTTTFQRVRDGGFSTVSDAVERVTGEPARTFARFLRELGPQALAGA